MQAHACSSPLPVGKQTIQGQVTFRRRLSSRLVFYDVLAEEGSYDQHVEVVVKEGVFGSQLAVKQLRSVLKLGDYVAVQGHYDSEHVFQAAQVTILQAWKDKHPGRHFKPQPSTRLSALLQQQGQQQKQQLQPPWRQQQQLEQPPSHAQRQLQQGSSASIAGAAVPYSQSPAEPSVAQPAAVHEPQLPVCKFWVNTGNCAKGSACTYAHLQTAGVLAAARAGWIQQRRVCRQIVSSSMGLNHCASAAAKGKRAELFAAWLGETFGRAALNAGAGVLDVAGGAGGMTFELAAVHGIKCTLIDPRPLKLNKQQWRHLKQARQAALIKTLTSEQLVQDKVEWCSQLLMPSGLNKQQQHQQQQMNEPAWLSDMQIPGQIAPADQLAQHASRTMMPRHGSHLGACRDNKAENADKHRYGNDSDVVQLHQVHGWFGPELWSTKAWQELFGSYSLVMGLHPDQATEHILDYAVQASKPFAIMPCCVFPRQSPDRQLLQDSKMVPVVSYQQLVEYLVQKGGALKAFLDFEGANTVVYRQQPVC